MSDVQALVEHARKHGVKFRLDGDRIHCRASGGQCPEDLRADLIQYKPELILLLQRETSALPLPLTSTNATSGDIPQPRTRIFRVPKPKAADEFIGDARANARAVFGKIQQLKNGAELDPLDRCWLFAGPPGVGKTSLAEAAARELAENQIDIEQVNGQSCSIDVVRRWREDGWYSQKSIRVRIVDEIDAASPAAQMELRTYLDKLPKSTVFIATSNKSFAEIPEQLQSRFKIYDFNPVGGKLCTLVGAFGNFCFKVGVSNCSRQRHENRKEFGGTKDHPVTVVRFRSRDDSIVGKPHQLTDILRITH
jgi:hypothetical protein